jgi:hypothetical protein
MERERFYPVRNEYIRKLTNSELSRGYVYISKNSKMINKNISVVINAENIGIKKIDNYGRIAVGRSIVANIGSKNCAFSIEDGVLNINLPFRAAT